MLKKLPILLLISVSLSACANNSNEKKMESTLIDYKNPKSICYGRLNYSIPKETAVNFGVAKYDGVKIDYNEDIHSYQEYEKFITNRIDELKKSPHPTEKTLYKNDISLKTNISNSHIIVFRKNESSESMYQIFGYIYLPLKHKMLILEGGSDNDKIDIGVKVVKDILEHIRFSKTDKSVTCFNDFYIEDYDNKINFESDIFFSFPSYPEVRVSIENRSRFTSDIELIPYTKKNLAELPLGVKAMVSQKDINIGNKTVDSMIGEEYSYNLSQRMVFERGFENMSWQYLGVIDDLKKSYVKFDLSSKNEDGNESDNALVSEKLVTQLGYFILDNIKNNDNGRK